MTARTTRELTPEDAEEAGALLARGGLVAFPTETVYGLGADAGNAAAVASLYGAKGRPSFNPLIAHVPSVVEARTVAVFDVDAERLAAAFWPGPLTLVLPAASGCPVCELARSGLETVAVRAPDHPIAEAILRAAGRPIVAPSANRSGRVSPTTADHVLTDLDGLIDAVLDGGATRVGLESTIVACLGGAATLLRPGGVPREAIEAALGRALALPAEDEHAPASPGRLASHYAPAAALRLDAAAPAAGEAWLGFGPDDVTDGVRDTLSASGDLAEAAARLFTTLRSLDATGVARIAVAPIPVGGLGDAIRDRLKRAAAPRG
nr:L-threonylcarbamoyladenylate synthase [Hansschlegelia quercus]